MAIARKEVLKSLSVSGEEFNQWGNRLAHVGTAVGHRQLLEQLARGRRARQMGPGIYRV